MTALRLLFILGMLISSCFLNRAERDGVVPSQQFRLLVSSRIVLHHFQEVLQSLLDDVHSLHHSSLDEDGDLDLHAFSEELDSGLGFRLEIVLVRRRGEADFLDDGLLLVFLGFSLLLGLLELELSVVDDLADRRMGLRADTIKVELHFHGLLESDAKRNDTKAFAFGSNQEDFLEMDSVVHQVTIVVASGTKSLLITVIYRAVPPCICKKRVLGLRTRTMHRIHISLAK